MTKFHLVVIAFLSFNLYSSAQQLSNFVAPRGYSKVLEAEGDLDKDGMPEVVYVYNTNKKDGQIGYFRVLYICKLVGGKPKLWKENRTVLRSSSDCGFCVDEGIDLGLDVKNNTIVIEQTFNHNSRHYSTHKDIFRYQNGDWFLIGATFKEYDTCEFDYTYDINFSTKKVDVALTYGVCDGDEDKKMPEDQYFKFKYPFKNLQKMDDFKPGKVELKIPNSKLFFYY